MNLDFLKAIKYVFEDKEWPRKVSITAGLFLVPIVNFTVTGYQVEIVRNVYRGESAPLPDWSNFGEKFTLGLPLLLLNLCLALPMFLLGFIGYFLTIASVILLSSDLKSLGPVVWGVAGMMIASIIGIYLIYFAYMLLFSLMQPAWLIRYATTGDWHSFFEIKKLFSFIRENLGPYLLATLLVFLINGALVFGSYIVGFFLTLFLSFIKNSNLDTLLFEQGGKVRSAEGRYE